MSRVTVAVTVGKTIEQNRGAVTDLTEAVTKNFSVSPESVTIVFQETTKENRAKAGKLAIYS